MAEELIASGIVLGKEEEKIQRQLFHPKYYLFLRGGEGRDYVYVILLLDNFQGKEFFVGVA